MPFDEHAPTAHQIDLNAANIPARRYRSLRWRILTPIVAVLMAALMLATYLIAADAAGQESEEAAAELPTQVLLDNAAEVLATQRAEAERIAFTEGVAVATAAGDGSLLQPIVEPLGALAGLDVIIITDGNGFEILGLQRVVTSEGADFSATAGSDLGGFRFLADVLNGAETASGLITLERRPMLVTASPIRQDGLFVGVVMVGADVGRALTEIRGDLPGEVSLFTEGQALTGSTFTTAAPPLEPDLYQAALAPSESIPTERLTLADEPYQAAYVPLLVPNASLGVLALYQPIEEGNAGNLNGQVWGLLMAGIVGAVCIAAYTGVSYQVGRLERVTQAVNQLAAGEDARTRMKPRDEIGQLGAAVDRYAAAAKVQVKGLQTELRTQRRQIAHLQALLDSLPQGVMVQDGEGRVMTMNAQARDWLGAYGDTQEAQALKLWAASLADLPGERIAPGVLALGEQMHFTIGARSLKAEAASILSVADKHIGMVILLQEAAPIEKTPALVPGMAESPALTSATRPAIEQESLAAFGQEIAREARALQRLVTEYHELTLLEPDTLRGRQHAVNVSDLLLGLVDDWRPTAAASQINLEAALPDEEFFILGDERRLLQALGYLIDNSIKYSLSGSRVMLKARPKVELSRLDLLIQDSGVGIALDEQPHIFTRFYRGNPVRPDGAPLTVPGAGQGLYLSRKIIEAHGGTLALASAPGQGTYVTVSLPLTADVQLEIPAGASERVSLWDAPTGETKVFKVK